MPRRSSSVSPSWCRGRPEVLAILQDVKDHPEDDTPRLVLADWLDEHGASDHGADHDRAAFIRVQLRLARTAESDPLHRELRLRSEQLSSRHTGTWRGKLAALDEGWRFE